MVYPNLYDIVAATDQRHGIGAKNDMLFRIKPDLDFFVRTTMGHAVIMGYKTYISLQKRPLPNRLNIVLSRQKRELEEGVLLMHSVEEVRDYIEAHPEIEFYNIGGEQIFEQLLPNVYRIYFTRVMVDDTDMEIDAFYPEFPPEDWQLTSIHADKENLQHKYPHMFEQYERRAQSKEVPGYEE